MRRHFQPHALPKLTGRLARCLGVALCCVILSSCPERELFTGIPAPTGEHWLRLVQISDTQLADEESPARMVRLDPLFTPAWRPQEAYGTQTLDATLRVINEIHTDTSTYPIDFVIATGDLADNAQRNEIRWFIDTMDGQWVVPDSGAMDGTLRAGAGEDNPKLGFPAEGLSPDIPWYTVFGNHDGLAVGVVAINQEDPDPVQWTSPQFAVIALILGTLGLDEPKKALLPTRDQNTDIVLGSEDVADPQSLRLDATTLPSGPIVPDDNRQYISRQRFIEEHFETNSRPDGHGFGEEQRRTGRAQYSFRPKADVPIRVIVLDTVAPDPPAREPFEFGVMTRTQFETFLKPEIEAAQEADEFVIIASHHPSQDFTKLYPREKVGTGEFRFYLSAQPNIVAHICGHTHRNHVTRIDGLFPYLEIETASVIDYPQEGRILDIFYDADRAEIQLQSTIFSHADNPTRLSKESLRRALVDREFWKSGDGNQSSYEELYEKASTVPGGVSDLMKLEKTSSRSSHEERYGREEDREFLLRFHRPQ